MILGASGVHPGLKAHTCAHVYTYAYTERGGRERGERGRKRRREREGDEERRKIDYLGNLKQGIELCVCVYACVSKTIIFSGNTQEKLLAGFF